MYADITPLPTPTAIAPFELKEDLSPGDKAEADELRFDGSDWVKTGIIRIVWDYNGSSIPSGEHIYCYFNQQSQQWHPLVTQTC